MVCIQLSPCPIPTGSAWYVRVQSVKTESRANRLTTYYAHRQVATCSQAIRNQKIHQPLITFYISPCFDKNHCRGCNSLGSTLFFHSLSLPWPRIAVDEFTQHEAGRQVQYSVQGYAVVLRDVRSVHHHCTELREKEPSIQYGINFIQPQFVQ